MPSQYYTEDFRDKALNALIERDMDGTGPEGKGPRTGRGMGKCPPKELEEQGITPEDREILKGLTPEQLEKAKLVAAGDEELDDELYEILFNSEFIKGMPYGTQKARTGDPYEWIAEKLEKILGQDEEEMEEANEKWVIKKDGKIIKRGFNSQDDAFKELHKLHSGSWSNAIKHEGYEIVQEGEEEPEKIEDTQDVVDKDEGIGGGESGEGSTAAEEVEDKEEKKDDEEDESEEIEKDDEKETDEEAQFAEWFNEQMKTYEFDEGLFDGVKKFIGVAKDVGTGVKAGVKAAKVGKGAGDVLSIAGTQMKANKFQRAYKEMWLGFNKGLKLMNPTLQTKISENKKVRDSVNVILGTIVEALERGKTLNLATAVAKIIPVGTNPEQAEAKAAGEKEGEGAAVTI